MFPLVWNLIKSVLNEFKLLVSAQTRSNHSKRSPHSQASIKSNRHPKGWKENSVCCKPKPNQKSQFVNCKIAKPTRHRNHQQRQNKFAALHLEQIYQKDLNRSFPGNFRKHRPFSASHRRRYLLLSEHELNQATMSLLSDRSLPSNQGVYFQRTNSNPEEDNLRRSPLQIQPENLQALQFDEQGSPCLSANDNGQNCSLNGSNSVLLQSWPSIDPIQTHIQRKNCKNSKRNSVPHGLTTNQLNQNQAESSISLKIPHEQVSGPIFNPNHEDQSPKSIVRSEPSWLFQEPGRSQTHIDGFRLENIGQFVDTDGQELSPIQNDSHEVSKSRSARKAKRKAKMFNFNSPDLEQSSSQLGDSHKLFSVDEGSKRKAKIIKRHHKSICHVVNSKSDWGSEVGSQIASSVKKSSIDRAMPPNIQNPDSFVEQCPSYLSSLSSSLPKSNKKQRSSKSINQSQKRLKNSLSQKNEGSLKVAQNRFMKRKVSSIEGVIKKTDQGFQNQQDSDLEELALFLNAKKLKKISSEVKADNSRIE